MTRAVIYCRVSTDDQEREGTSLLTQMESCIKYCEAKGYDVSYRFSEAYSGLTLHRPKLTELRELVWAGKVDVIVIYCLDRISRDPTHGVVLTQELERCQVKLEAVTEDVDNSELGKLISYIRGFASKVEAEKIKERTMRGKLAHVKNGRLPQGTGIGIYGYAWDKKNGRRTIIDKEAEVVRSIFLMALNGKSTNKIATTLNREGILTKSGSTWYPLTVNRILKNVTYTGKTYFGQTKRVSKTKVEAQPKENWTLLPDVTPPIISEEIFEATQKAMQKAKGARPLKENASYLLTGFIRCAKCGSPIGGTTLNGKYRYYKCRGASATATRDKICDCGYIKADEVEKFVWDRLVNRLSIPFNAISLLSPIYNEYKKDGDIVPILDNQIKQLKKKISSYADKEKKLYNLLAHDSVTEEFVLDAVKTLKQEAQDDERQLEQLKQMRHQAINATKFQVKLTEYCEFFSKRLNENMSFEARRRLLNDLSVRVEATPGNYRFKFDLIAEISSDIEEEFEKYTAEYLKEFEERHPEIKMNQILDLDVPLPEDTEFGITINWQKRRANPNLATIEQTWA